MTTMTTSISMSVNPLLFRDTQHLFDRRDSRSRLGPTVLAQGSHSLTARDLSYLGQGLELGDRSLDLLGHDQQLEDSGPAAISGLPAVRTAAATHQRNGSNRLLSEQRHDLRIRAVGFSTLRANLSHESLCQYSFERCGDEIGFDLE